MHIVNIHQAKTHLSELINQVLAGEKVIIAKAGNPLVVLCVYNEPEFVRQGGQLKGLLKIEENFDAPLPSEITKIFQGEEE